MKGLQLGKQMQKMTLAEQVLIKMKERKLLEDQARPHYEVLRLEALFEYELNQSSKEEIKQLKGQLEQQEETSSMLEQHLQVLRRMGKRQFPRIIVRPEFIGSENVKATVKQLYTKISNTFLRAEILRNKKYEAVQKESKDFKEEFGKIGGLESQVRGKKERDRVSVNQKRIKVIVEELRLKELNQEIEVLRGQIEEEARDKRELVQEYELKKVNSGNRKRKLKQIEEQIRDYQRKIEEAFNPQAYREHQMKVFEVQMKNEMLNKNIDSVRRRVKTLEVQTEQCERSMSKNKAFEKIGRIEGTETSSKRKKVHLHTHTEGFFLKCSKITPSKINMSMSIVGNEQKSRQLSKGRRSRGEVSIIQGFSPSNEMKSTGRTAFPRYCSAFSKRVKE